MVDFAFSVGRSFADNVTSGVIFFIDSVDMVEFFNGTELEDVFSLMTDQRTEPVPLLPGHDFMDFVE